MVHLCKAKSISQSNSQPARQIIRQLLNKNQNNNNNNNIIIAKTANTETKSLTNSKESDTEQNELHRNLTNNFLTKKIKIDRKIEKSA